MIERYCKYEIQLFEYRISNKEFRMTKCGIAALYLLNIKNGRIPYFDIHYSLFDILRFKKTPKLDFY